MKVSYCRIDDFQTDHAMTLDLGSVVKLDSGFDRVQELRDMLDIMIAYSAYCRASSRVIAMVQHRSIDDQQLDGALERYTDYLESIHTLSERIRSLIDLVSWRM